jgi:hypothetical protein
VRTIPCEYGIIGGDAKRMPVGLTGQVATEPTFMTASADWSIRLKFLVAEAIGYTIRSPDIVDDALSFSQDRCSCDNKG